MTECMSSEECQGLSVCTGVPRHAGNTLSHLGPDGEGRLDAFTGKEEKKKTRHIQGGLLTDKLCSFYCVFFFSSAPSTVSQETGTSGTNQRVEDAPGNQLVMGFKLQTCNR